MNNGIFHRRAFTSSKITASFLAILLLLFAAAPALAQEQAKKLVALLDYLGSDYKNAVKDGKVLNPDEYGEMQEFAKRGLELFAQLKAADKGDKAGVEALVKSLAQHVADKADPKAVAEIAKATKEKLLAAYNIVPYPRRLPSIGERQENLRRQLRAMPWRHRQRRRPRPRKHESQNPAAGQLHRSRTHRRPVAVQSI